ncbi:hypothetical protein MAC_05609 [Metarhizium acridum CQMa 102]|uniref:Uncharacterized protein n=1 Tax=Metarhizium acridum (strain CQMa 102) TaxID=655827 RepID=E9E6W1_METAQ|nr:uncharacterized protein MAC_05609 [Metarhizium acridum CQMa 102]EFY88400.1 hypothetical protein MAC_05609 [Metarhizium acridum CQMa 102]
MDGQIPTPDQAKPSGNDGVILDLDTLYTLVDAYSNPNLAPSFEELSKALAQIKRKRDEQSGLDTNTL